LLDAIPLAEDLSYADVQTGVGMPFAVVVAGFSVVLNLTLVVQVDEVSVILA
jgi:hypothetical protein